MNQSSPFTRADLEELDERLYSLADRVVPMRDIFKGDIGRRVIGLRHDVDDNVGAFRTALRMAEWEFEHGYSSTYFLLHGSQYWGQQMLERAPLFEELGHEVGLHVNGIADGLRTGEDPSWLVAKAALELRSCGVRVSGCVAHGDSLCRDAGFVNDELFVESARPDYGAPRRLLRHNGVSYRIAPVPRSTFGFEYDANWLRRGNYLSDSGGQWSQPFDHVVEMFGDGQLHMLVHPDWWVEAFAKVPA